VRWYGHVSIMNKERIKNKVSNIKVIGKHPIKR
jgi:hypothetical protein